VHKEGEHKNSDVWISSSTFKMKSGSTVADLLDYALSENNMSCEGLDKGYVSSVTWGSVTLSEFSNGVNSGWMYKVNGELPTVSINNCIISDGDIVEWFYTDDYTEESNSGDFADDETTTEAASEVTTEGVIGAEKKLEVLSKENTDFEYFADVNQSAWYFKYVEALHAAGVVQGKGDNLFYPADNVTRAEFVYMLYTIYGGGSDYEKADFSDVNENAWYYNALCWAAENKVTYGNDKNLFMPGESITRQNMATMLYRFAFVNYENKGLKKFCDDAEIAVYAKNAVYVLNDVGIIEGNEDGSFAPRRFATRAETAVVIWKILFF
jgi:hypothetical protein